MLMLIRIDQLTVWTMNLMWWNRLTRTFPDILYINLYICKETKFVFDDSYLCPICEQTGNRPGYPIPPHGIHSPNSRVADAN